MTQLLFPEFKARLNLSTQIESELLKEVRIEAKRRKLSLREAVEYGLKAFLEASKQSATKEKLK